MIKEESINRFLHSRLSYILLAILFMIATTVAMLSGKRPLSGETNGVLFSTASVFNLHPLLSMGLNIALILTVSVLLMELNKVFSFIRHVTFIYAGMFVVLESANPYITTALFDGTLLAVVVAATSFIVFNSFQSPYSRRSILLTFTILSAACTFQYAFLYLIPVYFIGFLQMRAMTMKGVIAMLIGMIVPFWILLGLGVVDFTDFRAPQLVNVWTHLDFVQSGVLIGTAAITALLTLILFVLNAFHIFSYRTQIRAYNGFFNILSIFTIIMMMIDYNNILMYFPVLNVCLSIQMAHFFTINNYKRNYVVILLFILASLGVYAWRILH